MGDPVLASGRNLSACEGRRTLPDDRDNLFHAISEVYRPDPLYRGSPWTRFGKPAGGRRRCTSATPIKATPLANG